MKLTTYDVAVIGGGPAGSATALHLARAGISVLLLEASDFGASGFGETVSPHVKQQVLQLGLSRNLNAEVKVPAQGIVSVWGSDDPHVSDFLVGIHGAGWHVDRAAFDRMLAENAQQAGVTVRCRSRVTRVSRRSRGYWLLEFAFKGKRFACECRFLVDATGRSGSSPLAQFSPRSVLDRLIAVVWTGKSRCDSPYLTVESVADGWFYSAALPHDRTTIVYMTDSDLYRGNSTRSPELWRERLRDTRYARERLPPDADLSELKIISAATVVRATTAERHWCAVGDAAFSHDPLSGLGVHNALESATHAASAIEVYLHTGKALSGYKSWVAGKLNDYLISRKLFYAEEQRWHDLPFWQRREQ